MRRGFAMSDTDQQIRDRIEEFVNQLSQLVRQTALDSVRDALGDGAGAGAAAGAGRSAIGRGARRKGEKRSSDQIAETTKGGGELRAEASRPRRRSDRQRTRNRHQGTDTCPIRKLVAERQLKTKGSKTRHQVLRALGLRAFESDLLA